MSHHGDILVCSNNFFAAIHARLAVRPIINPEKTYQMAHITWFSSQLIIVLSVLPLFQAYQYFNASNSIITSNYNRIKGLLYARCKNSTCYDAIPLVYSSNSYQQDYLYIYLAYYYNPTVNMCDLDFTFYNTSCSQFFCSSRASVYSLLAKYTNDTSLISNVMTPLFWMHNVCYYCNYTGRTQFFSLLANNSCPYFWQHDPNYCQEYENQEYENVLSYGTYATRAYKYLNYRMSLDPMLNLDISKTDDLLNLTVIRNQNMDHLAERARGEYPYMCYCPSYNRYGPQCDVYARILYPYYTELISYCELVIEIPIIITYILVVTIPKHVSTFKKIEKVQNKWYKSLFTTLFTRLEIVSTNISLASMICVAISNLFYSSTVWVIFNSLSFALIGLGVGILLIHWAHIHESAQELSLDARLSLRNRILLWSLIAFVICVIIVAAIGLNVNVIPGIPYNVYVAINNHLSFALLMTLVVFMGGYGIGFMVYGIAMYRVLTKVNTKLTLFKLKITRMMLLMDATFLHFMVWIVIYACTYEWRQIGPFIITYIHTLVHIAMFITYVCIGASLFVPSEVRALFCANQCNKK
jgi:hypothetical protein